MIKLKFDQNDSFEIKPTIFPDKTSQVWKIDDFRLDPKPKFAKIEWYWEEESELIWINQLICLLYQLKIEIYELYIPYLPYARQDKEVSNTSTFAKHVFLEMLLKEHAGVVTTLDAHSHHPAIRSYTPTQIRKAMDLFDPHFIVFPDAGAYYRYSVRLSGIHTIVIDKVRNQLTGKIEGLTLNEDLSEYHGAEEGEKYKLLIVDDLSDAGGTFKFASKFLKEQVFPNSNIDVGLYVTHFLNHGDILSYAEAGISKIYTTDSLTPYRNRYNPVDENIVKIIC